MKIKHDQNYIELTKCPEYFNTLCSIVQEHFNVEVSILFIKCYTGFFKVSSAQEYNKIDCSLVQEITVNDAFDQFSEPIQAMQFSKIDSIDTCTSHEKSDSDESKKSEIKSMLANNFVTVGEGVETQDNYSQTDGIESSSIGIGENAEKSERGHQYDEPVELSLKELECVIRKEAVEFKKKTGKRVYAVHNTHKCYHCSMDPIVGARFYCSVCSYSICERCEEVKEHEHEVQKHKRSYRGFSHENLNTDKHAAIINKIVNLGLGEYQKVKMVAQRNSFNLSKTVEALLFTE